MEKMSFSGTGVPMYTKLLFPVVAAFVACVFWTTQVHATPGCAWRQPENSYQDSSTGFAVQDKNFVSSEHPYATWLAPFNGQDMKHIELTVLRLVLGQSSNHNQFHCTWPTSGFGHFYCFDDGGNTQSGWSPGNGRDAYWAIVDLSTGVFIVTKADGRGVQSTHARAQLFDSRTISFFLESHPAATEPQNGYWASVKCGGSTQVCPLVPGSGGTTGQLAVAGTIFQCSPF